MSLPQTNHIWRIRHLDLLRLSLLFCLSLQKGCYQSKNVALFETAFSLPLYTRRQVVGCCSFFVTSHPALNVCLFFQIFPACVVFRSCLHHCTRQESWPVLWLLASFSDGCSCLRTRRRFLYFLVWLWLYWHSSKCLNHCSLVNLAIWFLFLRK